MKYSIVCNTVLSELVIDVNAKMHDGWEAIGGLVIGPGNVYVQALVIRPLSEIAVQIRDEMKKEREAIKP